LPTQSTTTPPSLESFSIGRSDLKSWGALHTEVLPLFQLGSEFLGDDDQWCRVFGSIRNISLPVEFVLMDGMDEDELEQSTGIAQRILQHSTASVAHLNLETSLYSGLEHGDWGSLYETAKPAFNKIIGSKVFSRLESIVLRGFVFTLKDLETFLLAHAGTLREVHLINCCLSEASETELIDSIKSRLQPALALTGVEIYALVHADHCRLGSNPDIPIIPQPPGGSVVDPPVLRKELEALFMGGRPNAVTEIKQISMMPTPTHAGGAVG
jgi:hypothetical protein